MAVSSGAETTADLTSADIGRHVPRRGNRLTRGAALLFLALVGWQVKGMMPDLNKFIIIGAPHTSNFDFILVLATAMMLNIRISWMGKHTLFRRPFGGLLRWLGGVPVDRKAAHGVVGENIDAFTQSEDLILCITPEGTRSRVKQWRSGFYRIAEGAKVPILMAAFDYERKVVGLGPVLAPSGDFDADLADIQAHYAPIRGKYPTKTQQR